MNSVFDHPGYEESILYSSDDYEPYGFAMPQLAMVADAFSSPSRFGAHQREIEAAVLRRLET